MTQDEIDIMWQQAMRQSIQQGEMYTRYQFAKLVAEKENKECEKLAATPVGTIAAAIRARRQA